MSILSSIEKPADRSIVCTISGDAGLGKTSLAATFPKPIFIRAEDGLQAIPESIRPDAFPKIYSVDKLWEQINALIKEKHDYQTVVLDSITQLETLFMQHILETDIRKPSSINTALGGYGAGRDAVAAMHAKLRTACDMLNRKGMHVVFIAHADTVTIEPPDDDPFTRYDLRLHKKSASPYLDNVDLVGYLKLETFTKGEDGQRKKAISTNKRLLICYPTAANVSKNRYGITDPIEFVQGQNPLVNFIPVLRGKKS